MKKVLLATERRKFSEDIVPKSRTNEKNKMLRRPLSFSVLYFVLPPSILLYSPREHLLHTTCLQ